MKKLLAIVIFLSTISIQAYGCLPPTPIRDLQLASLEVYGAECNSVAVFSATITNNGERKERSTVRFFVDGKEIWPCTRIVDVESGESIVVECKWKTVAGTHTVKSSIDELINEKDIMDNEKSEEINVFCCSEGFLEEYRCMWNWRQQKYQHADCSIEWKNVEYCSEGCLNGNCIAKCDEGYTDEYICSGNWLQRKYQYPNCSVSWINYQYCDYGCSNGYCLSPSASYCNFGVDIEVPSMAFVHNDMEAKVVATNYGSTSVDAKLDVYLCSNFCWRMPCSSTLYLEPGSSFTLTCTSFLQEAGNYQVIVEYEACGTNYTKSSPIFSVSYVYPSFYFAPSQPLEAKPLLNLKNYYSLRKCSNNTIELDITNTGDKDSTFYFSVEGEASSWISITPSVTLKAGERKTIFANVTVPCNIADGNYQFSVRARNSKEARATSFLSVYEERPQAFIPTKFIILVFLILILLALIYKRPKRRNEPETFEGDC